VQGVVLPLIAAGGDGIAVGVTVKQLGAEDGQLPFNAVTQI
jgi:hypothetical protein